MRRPLRAGLLPLLVLLLAGCATIPTSSGVNAHPVVPSAAPNYVVVPRGPAGGASPTDIVQGFVTAAQQGGTYSVARQFLTSNEAKRWRPTARVLVNDVPWTTQVVGSESVALTVQTSARLDEAGLYTVSSQRKTLSFALTQVRGQWRIADAPDGIVLADQLFPRNFVQQPLDFYSTDFKRVVPDMRWFPRRGADGPGVPAVLRQLLAGQAPMLRDYTVSAFPDGTSVVGTPAIHDALTSVAVRTPGTTPSGAVLTKMYQQLSGSLPHDAKSGLQLIVNGKVVPPAEPANNPQQDLRPAVLTGGRFGLLSASGLSAEDALEKRIAAAKPQAVTIATSQGFAAALTARGVEVIGAKGSPRVVDDRSGLIAPTVDQRGWVYSVQKDDPFGLEAHDVTGRVARFSAGVSADQVLSMEMSRDGTRLLLLVRTSSGPEAFVAGVLRDPDGMPTGLTSLHYSVQLSTATGASAATWVDDDSVAVLTTGPDEQQIVVQVLGGLVSSLRPLSNVRSIVGGAASTDLRALLSTGEIFWSPTLTWQPEFVDSTVSLLAVQR